MKKNLLLFAAICLAFNAFALLTGNEFHDPENIKIPLVFTENKGQLRTDGNTTFIDAIMVAKLEGWNIYITNKGISYVLTGVQKDMRLVSSSPVSIQRDSMIYINRVDVDLVNASINKRLLFFDSKPVFTSSYFKDTLQVQNVGNYSSFTIRNVYPNIDWHWKINANGVPEYEFIVKPGGKPEQIKMAYKWCTIEAVGSKLYIKTPMATIVEGNLKSFQDGRQIATEYTIDEKTKAATFSLGQYDKGKILTIDPPLELQWANQYGGSFATGFRGVADNNIGRIIAVGYTNDVSFPIVNPGMGAYIDSSLNNFLDIAILVLSNTGQVVSGTYYGGSQNDWANAVCTDKNSNVFITGASSSGNFPIWSQPGGYTQFVNNYSLGKDVILLKFDVLGQRLWATGIGGYSSEEEGLGIACDTTGSVFLTGSSSLGQISTVNPGGGAYVQGPDFNGTAFIFKFNATGVNVWTTYYGGNNGIDYGTAVTVSANNKLYVTGYTNSTNLPLLNLPGAYNQSTSGGNYDAFILRFTTNGVREWATYYGGNSLDIATAVTTTSTNMPIITGKTTSTNFPVLNAGGCNYFQGSNAGNSDVFIAKFSAASAQLWSTYLGGSGNDGGTGVAVDQYNNCFVTGHTSSINFPFFFPGNGGYYDTIIGGTYDAFMLGFSGANCQLWGTYSPGNFEYGNAVTTDASGKIFMVGEALIPAGGGSGGGTGGSTPWPNGNGAGGTGGAAAAFGGFGPGGADTCPDVAITVIVPPCPSNCNGQLELSFSGGTAPYTFMWNNGDTSLVLNNVCGNTGYAAVVNDANGCAVTAFFNELPLSALIVSANPQSCEGFSIDGSMTAQAVNGSPPYTYAWYNTGGTQVGTGSTVYNINGSGAMGSSEYYVQVTDAANCTVNSDLFYLEAYPYPDVYGIYFVGCEGVDISGNSYTIQADIYWNANPYWFDYSFFVDSGYVSYSSYGPSYATISQSANVDLFVYGYNYQCWTQYNQYVAVPTFVPTVDVDDISCFGAQDGAIEITGVAASNYNFSFNPTYYFWSNNSFNVPGISGLSAGTYSVTVMDQNNCGFAYDTVINEPPAILLSANTVNPTCFGSATGQINISASGGGGGFSYAWSHNQGLNSAAASLLQDGSYTVTVSDANNCTETLTQAVQQPLQLQLQVNAVPPTCTTVNGSASAVVTGGTQPYTYNWGNGNTTNAFVNNLGSSTYTVSVTDYNGCTTSQQFYLSDSLVPDIYAIEFEGCFNDMYGVSADYAGHGANFYFDWSIDTGSIIPGPTPSQIFITASANVTLRLYGTGNCYDEMTVHINVPIITGQLQVVNNNPCYGDSAASIQVNNISSSNYTFVPSWYLWNNLNPQGPSNLLSGLAQGTYTVTVNDNVGCGFSDTVTITDPPQVVASINSTITSCTTNGSAIATVTGGTPGYQYNWGAGYTSSNTANNLQAGSYVLTVTDINSCVDTASFIITQSLPVTLTATVQNATCNGLSDGSITLSVSGGIAPYTYQWLHDAQLQSSQAINLEAGVYTAIGLSGNGCSDTILVTVSQPAAQQINIDTTPATCAGQTGTATAVVNGGVGVYLYNWGSGNVSANTATGLAVGQYTLTVTDASGCTATKNYTITQPDSILVTETITQPQCANTTGAISLQVVGGNGSYSYVWSHNAQINSNAVTSLAAGNYTVTVTDALGCNIVSSYTISNPIQLQLSLTVENALCYGETGSAFATVTGGTPGYTYNWGQGFTPLDSITGLLQGLYNVTVQDANGCTATTSYSITIPDSLAINTFVQQPLCNGSSTGSITLTVNGGTTGYNYIWAGTSSTSNTANNLSANTYSIAITDTNGCSAVTTVVLSEPSALTVNLSTILPLCFGDSGTVTAIVAGGTGNYGYNWGSGITQSNSTLLPGGNYAVTITDGNNCSLIQSFSITQPQLLTLATVTQLTPTCNGSADGSITWNAGGGTGVLTYAWAHDNLLNSNTANNLPAGNYTIYVTDVNGCSDTAQATLSQPAQIQLSVTTYTPACYNPDSVLAVANITAAVSPFTYNWGPGLSTNDSLFNASSGNYQLVISDSNNCTATASFVLNVPAVISVQLNTSNNNCFGVADGSITITASGGSLNYTYSITNGTSALSNSTGIFNSLTAGNYNYFITDVNNCSLAGNFVINAAVQNVFAVNTDTTACPGETDGQLTVSGGSNVNAPFQYSLNGGSFQQDSTFGNLAENGYTIVVSDANNCLDTLFTYVIAGQPLQVEIQPDTITINAGDTAFIMVNETNVPAQPVYTWTPANDLSCDDCVNPVATPTVNTQYILTVADAANAACAVAASVTVIVNETDSRVVVPDAFTPNGDGNNDMFFPIAKTDKLVIKEFHIFNRWGEMIYNSPNPWDGNIKGETQPVGTYNYKAIYSIGIDGGDVIITGTFTLLR